MECREREGERRRREKIGEVMGVELFGKNNFNDNSYNGYELFLKQLKAFVL